MKYTVEDVAAMESHAELIGGELLLTEWVTPAHNIAVHEIRFALQTYIEEERIQAKVFMNSIALYCDELCEKKGNLFLPDIMLVSDETGIKNDGVHTAPRFVVEVISVDSKKTVCLEKMHIYKEIGVQEYWIVNLERKTVTTFFASQDFLEKEEVYPDITSLSIISCPGARIDLSSVFCSDTREYT